MTRLSFVAFLALAFSSVAFAAPPASQEIVAVDDVRTTGGWSYSICGDPSDIVTIKSLDISPDPPKPGQRLTVTVNAYTSETIEEGAYADVTVKMGLVKLLTKTFDICDEARNANATIQCPVKEGEYTIVQTADLPKEIPPGKFSVNIMGYTANDEELVCLNLVVDFRRFPHFW